MNLKDMTYGIVGLGIMGGSLAKSIRANVLSMGGATGKILACNRSRASLEAALSDGVIDQGFASDQVRDMIKECDLLFVCLYPSDTLGFLRDNKEFFKSCSIVTDISGVKGIFEKSLPSLLRSDVDFIIGHPMAGGEKEGYANSSDKFFINHNYILCPQEFNKKENLDLMRGLVTAMGFTRITETSCGVHDNKIGFTSQLCHVIAGALVQSAADDGITAFGGGSFEDLTRIAMINAPLWTELFTLNKEKLCAHIEKFEAEISKIKSLIQNEDAAGLTEYLSAVRDRRLRMGSIRQEA